MKTQTAGPGTGDGSRTGSGLLLALEERQCDNFERLRFAAQVDVQGRAGFGELDVDVGHGNRVAQGGAGLAGVTSPTVLPSFRTG